MRPTRILYPVLLMTVAILLLGVLGAYWPRWVDAAPAKFIFAPSETIGDAITYQGYLTDSDDVALSGAFTMRFEIYNAPEDGDLLWESGDTAILVNDGLFEARLEIPTDIFNGEALWVAQTINDELLTPRQEILPAPMAHTLRPGAIMKGTANAFPNNYVLDVKMNNDALAFNRGAITGQSTTGNAIYGLAQTGRAIYGQTEDGYAVYGFDGGSEASRGYAGYFYSTNGVGVYGYSNGDRSFNNIYAPGVYGQSNQGVGVYGRGDTSNSFSFFNEGGRFEGGSGVYAIGTDDNGYGGEFRSSYRGIFAQGSRSAYDGYFGTGAGISATNIVNRSGASQSLAVNLGTATIAPGDLVAMVGLATNPENGEPVLGVAKVDQANRNGVIGVASEAITAKTVPLEAGNSYVDFTKATAAIAPKSYLTIITNGLAPAVNLAGLEHDVRGEIGDKMVLSASGQMARDNGGVDIISIGKVAGPVDESTGTVPLFIDID